MTCRRGDVALIPFPHTDLNAGKRRPVLVLQDPDDRGDFLAAAITSQPGHDDAIALLHTDFAVGALPKPSWLRGKRLFSLNQTLVTGVFGALSPGALRRVHGQICSLIGCDAA